MRALWAMIATLALFSCDGGSNFAGGGSKAGPEKKAQDAKAPARAESKDGKETEKAKNRTETTGTKADSEKKADEPLGNDTVTPEKPEEIVKVPENTIVKGSFSVWTIPADPEPLMDYDIYIEVKLPSNVTSYSREDLSGQVIGTDGYNQPIGRDAPFGGINSQRFINSQAGRATLIISVPGALNLVKDTIDIRSQLLNESQKIEIVF